MSLRSPDSDWRPPIGIPQRKRVRAMARGHTIWKTIFDGKDKLKLYLHQFEMVTSAKEWTPGKAARHLMNSPAHLPPDPTYRKVTAYPAVFESATKRPSESGQTFAIRVTDLTE